MKNENLIHVRLEYEEAVESKKNVLSSEMNLIRIMRIIKEYHSLRLNELKLKSSLYRKLKEIKKDIKSLQLILPKLELPQILKKEQPEIKEPEKEIIPKEKKYDTSLESELKEIQEKLKALQR